MRSINPLLPFGISMLTGKLGRGKSLTMAWQAWEAVKKKLPVHADFTLYPFEEEGFIKECYDYEYDYRFRSLDQFNKIKKSLILVDEAQSIGLNARRFSTNENLDTIKVLTDSRKMGNSIVLGAQLGFMLDKISRFIAEYKIKPSVYFSPDKIPVGIDWEVYLPPEEDWNDHWIFYETVPPFPLPISKLILNSYNTDEIIEWDRGDNLTRSIAKGINLEELLEKKLKKDMPWPYQVTLYPKSGKDNPLKEDLQLEGKNKYKINVVDVAEDNCLHCERKPYVEWRDLLSKRNNGWGINTFYFIAYPTSYYKSFKFISLAHINKQRPSITTVGKFSLEYEEFLNLVKNIDNISKSAPISLSLLEQSSSFAPNNNIIREDSE